MDPRPFTNQLLPPPSISHSQFPSLTPHHLPHQPIPHANPEPDLPTSASVTQPPTLKRTRTSGAGSRGVSNLTPEQLAKKRANDREAQRAIRERTKTQIETLEKKIRELTAQKPYLELQDALRQKNLVEAENREIKSRLASVQCLIEPLLGPNPLNPLVVPPQQTNHNLTPTIPTNDAGMIPAVSLPPRSYDGGSVRSSTPTASNYAASPCSLKQTPPISHANFPPQPVAFPPTNTYQGQGSGNMSIPARSQDDNKYALAFLMQSRQPSHDSATPQERRRSASANPILPMDPIVCGPSSVPLGLDASGQLVPFWALPVRNFPETCPLDRLLLDFLADKRKQAMDGAPLRDLIGPAYPSFASLRNPARKAFSHPLSKVFTDMLATFPSIATLPEQVAILYMMFLFMRYQLSPTPENYSRLPHWFQPRPSQILTPHPAWADHLPWPLMRDKMTQIFHSVPFDEFFIPYTTTVSLNWPYGEQGVLVPVRGSQEGLVSQEVGELAMTPEFEKHMMDLGNWSLGTAFKNAHSALVEGVRIVDHDKDGTRVRTRS